MTMNFREIPGSQGVLATALSFSCLHLCSNTDRLDCLIWIALLSTNIECEGQQNIDWRPIWYRATDMFVRS
jgi:hypothetical protein